MLIAFSYLNCMSDDSHIELFSIWFKNRDSNHDNNTTFVVFCPKSLLHNFISQTNNNALRGLMNIGKEKY